MAKSKPLRDDRTLGRQIRKARRGVGATQIDVALRAGVSQSTVAKTEYGVPATPGTLKRILDALRALEAEAAVERTR